jgi:hypothetical protein
MERRGSGFDESQRKKARRQLKQSNLLPKVMAPTMMVRIPGRRFARQDLSVNPSIRMRGIPALAAIRRAR